jgi:hypothetical protein
MIPQSLSKQEIIQRLRDYIHVLGLPDVGLESASYVLEEHIPPALPLIVQRKYLIPSEDYDQLVPFVESGASWVHANLYLTQEDTLVIGLIRGQLCGNPNVHINVSIDRQRLHLQD